MLSWSYPNIRMSDRFPKRRKIAVEFNGSTLSKLPFRLVMTHIFGFLDLNISIHFHNNLGDFRNVLFINTYISRPRLLSTNFYHISEVVNKDLDYENARGYKKIILKRTPIDDQSIMGVLHGYFGLDRLRKIFYLYRHLHIAFFSQSCANERHGVQIAYLSDVVGLHKLESLSSNVDLLQLIHSHCMSLTFLRKFTNLRVLGIGTKTNGWRMGGMLNNLMYLNIPDAFPVLQTLNIKYSNEIETVPPRMVKLIELFIDTHPKLDCVNVYSTWLWIPNIPDNQIWTFCRVV